MPQEKPGGASSARDKVALYSQLAPMYAALDNICITLLVTLIISTGVIHKPRGQDDVGGWLVKCP